MKKNPLKSIMNIFSKKVEADSDYKPYPYNVEELRKETAKTNNTAADLEESYKLYALRESSSGAFMHAVKQTKEKEAKAKANKAQAQKLNTK